MILLIDNYDSFTYNLSHLFQMQDAEVSVFRNDAISIEEIKQLNPSRLVISPGPGRPEHAGITINCIKTFAGKIPMLGVCLGHQAIAQAFGAVITQAQTICHGKTSEISHNNMGIFRNTPNPLTATRYHSLVVQKETLSNDFTVTAWTNDKTREIMGIKHNSLLIEGVQFHPESILTEHGHLLIKNFLTMEEKQ